MEKDIRNIAFDIVILAGQSNAEGNGVSEPKRQYHNDGVYELTDNSLTIYGYGILDYQKQNSFKVEYASYRKSDYHILQDISETFADLYIQKGYLEKGRKILIVKAAVGGTGFSLRQWGVGNPLHHRLKDMVDYALSLNKSNRLVAFLWHQGEHDAFEQPSLNKEERFAFYYDSFKGMMEDILATYNAKGLPIVAGEMVDSWANQYKDKSQAIEEATVSVLKDLGHGEMASSSGLLSNKDTFPWSGDDIHFSADSIEEFGHRYFACFERIRSKE